MSKVDEVFEKALEDRVFALEHPNVEVLYFNGGTQGLEVPKIRKARQRGAPSYEEWPRGGSRRE